MPRQAILFLIDTQGAHCVGAYAGRSDLGTPNLDRLAGEGIRFDRAYCCAPVCGPARSALFTGLYPHSNGVLGNNQAPQRCFPTLGERLAPHGCRTAYIGKWHLDGTDYFGSGRCPPGWDPACWFDGRNYLDSLPDETARNLSRRILSASDVAEHAITAEFTHAHRTADRAIEFIRRHRNEDFFLVVSIDEPHHPFICPEPFVSAFDDFELPVGPGTEDSLANKPQHQREWAEQCAENGAASRRQTNPGTFRSPAYFACNSYCDHEVGRVLQAIGADAPQALVVYTADHGDMCGTHRLCGKGPAMYEEIVRIPLIVRWPETGRKGAVTSRLASHIDLVPTFLEYFGVEIPPILQGSSLLAGLRSDAAPRAAQIFIEFNRYEIDHDGYGAFEPIRCAFDGRHKLAVNLLDTDELYDLRDDPAELNNRIDDPALAEVRDRLHDALLDWMNTTRDPLRGPHWGRRSWRTVPRSTWGGATRPKRFDPEFLPNTLLYRTAREVDRWMYEKG